MSLKIEEQKKILNYELKYQNLKMESFNVKRLCDVAEPEAK